MQINCGGKGMAVASAILQILVDYPGAYFRILGLSSNHGIAVQMKLSWYLHRILHPWKPLYPNLRKEGTCTACQSIETDRKLCNCTEIHVNPMHSLVTLAHLSTHLGDWCKLNCSMCERYVGCVLQLEMNYTALCVNRCTCFRFFKP